MTAESVLMRPRARTPLALSSLATPLSRSPTFDNEDFFNKPQLSLSKDRLTRGPVWSDPTHCCHY